MVRETRHLWVGNLPDNIREERIREHFKRYGRVQSVKVLARGSGGAAAADGGTCAAVAFMDIKSAAKAHNSDKLLDERAYTTEYYEPAAIPSTASAGSSPAGSGYSASSGSVSSARYQDSARHAAGAEEGGSVAAAVGSAALAGGAAAAAAGAAAGSVAPWRGTNDSADRGEYRRGGTPAYCAPQHYRRYAHPPAASPGAPHDKTHHRWYESSAPSTPGAPEGSGSGGGGTRRRRRSGSQASSRSSSSSDNSSDSRASTPTANHRAHLSSKWSSSSGRPLAICVRNLPARSSDSSLKDGLYHEYKKHGKVAWVKVVGASADRYAVVRFKKPSDVEKALEVSQDKLFFGCKISVAPHQGSGAELEEGEPARPYETDLDENHPKATRTLFIGNLEKDVTIQQLREKFKHFGRIIEIDVKKQSGGAGYAFCQYATISSVVEAIRAMDGEYVGASRVKLGFGKSMATACVWIDGLAEHTEKQDAFYEQLEKHGGGAGTGTGVAGDRGTTEASPRYTRHDSLNRYEGSGRSRGSYSRSTSRPPRYAGADHYDLDYSRYRVYDEFGCSSPAEMEGAVVAGATGAGAAGYEEARSLQSVVVASPRRRAPRHRRRRSRDSSPDEVNRKERHRSGGSSRLPSELRPRSPSDSRRRRTSEAERRRHRRRRDDPGSPRADTPLRDELPEGPAPADPRMRPVHRDRIIMTLPLPKFAETYLARNTPAAAAPATPAPAPASPPRAPSASSSSGGSAPHSPSLEERIKSLDEKYEKWSGSRAAAAEAAERGRFRHRLLDLDLDMKEVKPSDVARSFLTKRSVFDEDTERLEGAANLEKRSTSPSGSPRSREPRAVPRALQYPFPSHPAPPPPPPLPAEQEDRVPSNGTPARTLRDHRILTIDAVKSEFKRSFVECSEVVAERESVRTVIDTSASVRSENPRVIRTDRVLLGDKQSKSTDTECKRDVQSSDSGNPTRSPSLDKSHPDPLDKKLLEKTDRDRTNHDRDPRREVDKHRHDYCVNTNTYEKIPAKEDCKEHQVECNQQLAQIDSQVCQEPNDEQIHSDIREELMRNVLDETKIKVEFPNISSSTENDKEKQLIKCEQHKDSTLKSEIINMDKVVADKVSLDSNNKKKEENSELFVNCESKEQSNFDNKIVNDHISISSLEKAEKHKKEQIEKDIKESASNKICPVFIKDKFEKEEQIDIQNENSKKEIEIATSIVKCNDRIGHQSPPPEKLASVNKDIIKDVSQAIKLETNIIETAQEEKDKSEKVTTKQKEIEIIERDKSDRENERRDEKTHRHDAKKERLDKDKRKDDGDNVDLFNHANKSRSNDKHKHDRHRKEHSETRRETKKDKEVTEPKSKDVSRKSSRDESCREMQRKDSSDSTTSRTSHESTKYKDIDIMDSKDSKHSGKQKHSSHDHNNHKIKSEKESHRNTDSRRTDNDKHNHDRCKEVRSYSDVTKEKSENHNDKHRHYSVDSVDVKRKERLISSSSLPSNIGQKRRLSSQDIFDCMVEESKRAKTECKVNEKRDTKDSKPTEKSKIPKFNKGHFAKLLESKIKDDKKNQVKTPDDKIYDWHDSEVKENKTYNDKNKCDKKSPKHLFDEIFQPQSHRKQEDAKQEPSVSPRGIEFLATLELRSSEEDEKQKAMRKEMKEKKRIQQLQQIQELQMQHDALQGDKIKDDKKIKDERKKEAIREKRMSTERKSRDEKGEIKKRQQRPGQSSDTSDSDEPKKHSIFDIVDDGPTYISMYDKVKARSCKNMQKQEEEKRQEKIKAKFSQLKQSRAKREEKKRSTSWDGDSDSDQDRKKYSHKYMMASSSEDERNVHSIRREPYQLDEYEVLNKIEKLNYCNDSANYDEQRNKLSRKNSRSRIMSDTSDDDTMKRNVNNINIKKEIFSDEESDYINMKSKDANRDFNNSIKKEIDEKYAKENLINLFGDNLDDKKCLKKLYKTENSHNKISEQFLKSDSVNKLDFSSEGEYSNKNLGLELRKKHKKKQKKPKLSMSEDDTKSTDFNERSPVLSGVVKHRRNSEKSHKHSNRKERRKEKLRGSTDCEDLCQEKNKTKKGKKMIESGSENKFDYSNTIRRDEKMENIFGPLSDDSDGSPASSRRKQSNFAMDLPTAMSNDKLDFISKSMNEFMTKEKEESRRRKEKRRKEKRFITRDDENSLDVDAAGKAIEASLFADSISENEGLNSKVDVNDNGSLKLELETVKYDDSRESSLINEDFKHMDKLRKDIKEKKKKKKKSKDERQNRHYHHEKLDLLDKYSTNSNVVSDNISVKCSNIYNKENKEKKITEDTKSALQSPSLPRLTDSPPPLHFGKSEDEVKEVLSKIEPVIDSNDKKEKSVTEQPNSMEKNMNDLPEHKSTSISKSPSPKNSDTYKTDKLIPSFVNEINENISENAVNSISEFDKQNELKAEDSLITNAATKTEDKPEDKPRAVISQEETEDAVAALLGESFGANDSFVSCFDEVEDTSTTQPAGTSIESDNIPEEDAEEMRQAVQNLNASELEIKPDTPLSENDLQIDTDTEEIDDTQQETPEKVPVLLTTTAPSLPILDQKMKVNERPLLNISAPNKGSAEIVIKPAGFQRYNETIAQSEQTRKDLTISPNKRELFQQTTSTATPVISTTWTLSGNKLREQHVINVTKNHLSSRDEQTAKISTNIVQIKSTMSQNISLNSQPRAVVATPVRKGHTFVKMIRPSLPGLVTNLQQPPTIKIPDHHVMYQKQGSLAISPRMTNESRLQSPKLSPQSDMSSPRMILSPTQPGMGLSSPTSGHQRSPGHLTVVRMQQPPLSPIQTMHLPHVPPCRTMVSPNRTNSVLVQAHATPIHMNRLPVTPVLTSLSKPVHTVNALQPSKNMTLNATTAVLHQQKNISEIRKTDPRVVPEMADTSKFVISPSSLQQTTNPTVMAQNRLIMQNLQNATLHMPNKFHFNNSTHLSDKIDVTHIPFKQEAAKVDVVNKPYGQSPIIHIATVNQSTNPGHTLHKPVISINQEQFNLHRPHVSNVIHSVNSQRLLTTVATTESVSVTSVIQGDPNKPMQSSVLSMAPIRSPVVPTRLEKPTNVSVTSSVLNNVVMTPVLMKTSCSYDNFSHDNRGLEPRTSNMFCNTDIKQDNRQFVNQTIEDKPKSLPGIASKANINMIQETVKLIPVVDTKNRTDFEDLLKDTTNEIKVTQEYEGNTAVSSKAPEVINSVKAEEKIDDSKLSTEIPQDTKVNRESLNTYSTTDFEIKDDSEAWTAKEMNIESVIKKVDDLCDLNNLTEPKIDVDKSSTPPNANKLKEVDIIINGTEETDASKPIAVQLDPLADTSEPRSQTVNKRGGRNARGKKLDKQQDRVQTRQISKPVRGGSTSRRGRGGRAKVDKKVKISVNSAPTLSGDVYDFHDDSGDETETSSQNKNETRPRLILTIKSPLTSAMANTTTTSIVTSVSIPSKDQSLIEKTSPLNTNKDDKSEDFLSPALNTRKSRRLLEKDGNRNTVDEVIENVLKNPSLTPSKANSKDGNGRRSTRQAVTKSQDKGGSEIRKSPRGGKRMRDRSSSETSIDSSDEKSKKDELIPPERKLPKLVEMANGPTIPEKTQVECTATTTSISEIIVSNPASATPSIPAPVTVVTAIPTPTPMPIMKPPKKMISEISAKLGSNFENIGIRPINPIISKESDHPPTVISGADKPLGNDMGIVRMEKLAVPDMRLGLLSQDMRGGYSGVEEADVRVQSPALPHRPPPLMHRQQDRVTPILVRSGETEALEACRASPARAGAVGGVGPGGAGGSRSYRASFDPSLPRGAHHPPPPPAPHPTRLQPPAAARLTHTQIPQGSPQGSITGEGMYPHFSQQHYQVYQQHFRATQQDIRATPSPYTRSPRSAEGSEAPTPPLELRRPPSARVPRPAHSPSPADRLISGRGSPPPAHGGAGVSRLPSALPPPGPPGPPHASQVPSEADSLQMLLTRYPVMWQGLLALKNDGAAVQMHFVHGNPSVARGTLPGHVDGSTPPLRIAQRMRLEPVQLEAVHRKMQMENEHCMLLALPCGRDHMDVLQQSTNLSAGFITYLQRKQAAGIVNVAPPGHQQAMYTVHIFPSCEFANENLNRIAPDLLHRVADIAHLLIVIATV